MTNHPRRKGTAGETAVVRWWHLQGQTQVERMALHGSHDLGDLTGIVNLVQSIKAPGQGARVNFSAALTGLEVMRDNVARRAPELPRPDGIVIARRVGYPDVGDWYACQRLEDWWRCYQRGM